MTREEALDDVEVDYDIEGYEIPDESMTSFSETINLISKIYDDFESRTCENCILWDKGHCDRDIDDNSDEENNPLIDITSFDFGCNKWEKKK